MADIVYSDKSLKKRIGESLRALVSTPGFARAAHVSKKQHVSDQALASLEYTMVPDEAVFAIEPGALLVDVVRWAVGKLVIATDLDGSLANLTRWSMGENMVKSRIKKAIFFVVDDQQMVVNQKIMSREHWREVNSLLENQLEGSIWFISYSSVPRKDGEYNLLVRTPRQVPAFTNNAKPTDTGSFYHLDELGTRGGMG